MLFWQDIVFKEVTRSYFLKIVRIMILEIQNVNKIRFVVESIVNKLKSVYTGSIYENTG